MNSQEDVIDSVLVCEMLGISKTNLRQIVFRKLLTPVGKYKRRSTFDRAQVESLKLSRSVSIPLAE